VKRIILIAAAMAFVFAGAVWAQPYIGAKTGMMMVDDAGTDAIDNLIPIGVLFGYEIAPRMAIEGEFNYKIAGGGFNVGLCDDKGGLDLWTLAAYFAYRYPLGDNLYLKGKAGVLYESASWDWPCGVGGMLGGDSDTDTGLSIGAGVGMKLNEKVSAEAEFTVIESDVNYFSIGLNMAL
jgi:outer membrane immunogenic protein